MKKTCGDCLRLDLDWDKEAAKLGWGLCQTKPPGCYLRNTARICEKFEAAPLEVVEKRKDLLK